MKYALLTLMWDDNLGEGFVKLRDNFDRSGWVTKMDFLTDVIRQLEDLKDLTYDEMYKDRPKVRF